jgi:tetratricopeptide (TPR) repeat protein
MALTQPVLGYGPETFVTEFPRLQSIELARAYPDFYHESPHNVFIDAAVGQGIPGLLLMLAFVPLGAYAGYTILDTKGAIAAPLLAALAAVLVCQQFVVFVLATYVSFYLLIAILVALASVPVTVVSPMGTYARSTLRLCGIGASAVIAVFAYRLCWADYHLAIAQSNISKGDASSAANAYSAVMNWLPPGSGNDLFYSRAMTALARTTPVYATRLLASRQAYESGVRAARVSEDRQNAWYNLAILFAAQNNQESVERSLRTAIAWAPNWFKPHWMLAQVLALSRRYREALVECEAAVARDGGKNPEVLATLDSLKKKGSAAP